MSVSTACPAGKPWKLTVPDVQTPEFTGRQLGSSATFYLAFDQNRL